MRFIVSPALTGILGGTIYKEILTVLSVLLISTTVLFVIAFMLKESKLKAVVSVQLSEKENIKFFQ